jgi:hypothetical protein
LLVCANLGRDGFLFRCGQELGLSWCRFGLRPRDLLDQGTLPALDGVIDLLANHRIQRAVVPELLDAAGQNLEFAMFPGE